LEKSTLWVLIVLLGVAAYHLGSRRARGLIKPDGPRLHSLPGFYGYYLALWATLPAMMVILLWLLGEGQIITAGALAALPAEMTQGDVNQLSLLVNDIRNVAAGSGYEQADTVIKSAAERYLQLERQSNLLLTVLSLCVSLGGALHAQRRITPEFRARNQVEKILTFGLTGCALLAILTDGRYRPVRPNRVDSFLSDGTHHRLPFWSEVEPANRNALRPGGFVGGLRRYPLADRHAIDFNGRHDRCRPHRPALGHLSLGICGPPLPIHRQTVAGNPGRYPDCGLWFLCRIGGRAVHS